jgi:hypothetical protein
MTIQELYNKLGEHLTYHADAEVAILDNNSGDVCEIVDVQLELDTEGNKDTLWLRGE